MRMLLIAALVILLMHYVIGVLCLLILALFYLAIRFQPSEKLLKILILISSLVSAFLIALTIIRSVLVFTREKERPSFPSCFGDWNAERGWFNLAASHWDFPARQSPLCPLIE